jgi:hypothetical protein
LNTCRDLIGSREILFIREEESESSLLGFLAESQQFTFQGCFDVSKEIVDVELLKSFVLGNLNNLDKNNNCIENVTGNESADVEIITIKPEFIIEEESEEETDFGFHYLAALNSVEKTEQEEETKVEDQIQDIQNYPDLDFHFLASSNANKCYDETEDNCSEVHSQNIATKKFGCHVCNFASKYSINLKKHIFSKHPDIESGLSQAMRHHCHLCERRFYDKRHLQNHLNSSHFNVRPYSCEVCAKSFFQKVHMQIHLKIHQKEKEHICRSCRKSFRLAHHLRRHRSNCQYIV